MTDEDGDIEIELTEEVRAQLAADPELAAAAREIFARMRQAMYGVKSGQYKGFEDAMEAISGFRPVKVDDLDD